MSPYFNVLDKVADIFSRDDYDNNFKEKRNGFKLKITLHIEEMRIFARHLIHNQSLAEPSFNDHSSLGNPMLFFCWTFDWRKKSTNHCTKLVCNLKAYHLHKILVYCLEKAKEYDFKIILTSFDIK